MQTNSIPPLPVKRVSGPRIFGHTLFGIILPAFALGFEIATGLSNEIYLNPIPNLLYVLLVGMVPAIIALNLYRCIRRAPLGPWDFHLNSFCITISLAYALLYLPITPFAALGIIAYGMGLLPLAPLISLIAAYRIRKEMKRQLAPTTSITWRHFSAGFAIALALLFIPTIPTVLTNHAMTRYARADADAQVSTIQFLRTFGSDRVLLKACYGNSGPSFFGIGNHTSLDRELARKLFYRVTGESFNSHRIDSNTFFPVRGDSRDSDLGGEHVGQRIEELTLEESRLDGILKPEFGSGYVEWTMVFRNDHRWRQQEARMLISMPTGGVASRVTLWVNGEPREAAFGTKAKVRAAYQNVAVRQNRDPILVNWAGPDLLLAQCFPIPSDGGTMKVRIGISFPLESNGADHMQYRYPCIVAENFNMPDTLQHSVWYEEAVDTTTISHPAVELSNEQLQTQYNRTQSKPSRLQTKFTSALPHDDATAMNLLAKLPTQRTQQQPDAVVIDGSHTMADHAPAIAHWLTTTQGPLHLYFAGDELHDFQGTGPACAEWLLQQKFAGGQDNVPALTEAIRGLQTSATQAAPKTIYWFSGPQPIQLSGTERIRQLFERRPLPIKIVGCLTSRDYNALYELAPLAYSDTLHLSEDGLLTYPVIRYEALEATLPGPEGSSHPYRIWLANRIRTLAAATYANQAHLGPAQFKTKITQLANQAANAYLVTQLSGAVVLETDQQYKDNDLEAGDPNRTPTVPEAKHYALILGLASLFCIAARRRLQQRPTDQM